MSKQTLAIVGILILTFGSGVGVGFLLVSDHSQPEVAAQVSTTTTSGFYSDATAQDREQGNSFLSSRIRELEMELGRQKLDQQATVLDRMAFFEKYHQKIGVQPFDQSLSVTPEMAELLGLSKEQKEAVGKHLAEIKGELEKVEDANTTLTKQTPNSVAYDIGANKQGDALKDQLHELLVGDMGEDKTKVFMDGAQWPYQQDLFGFLEHKRQIEITWKQQDGLPLNMYTVKENYDDGSFSTMNGALQPEFQKYLPDGVKP